VLEGRSPACRDSPSPTATLTRKSSGALPLNANGVASFSPRLRGTSYLGKTIRRFINRNAVASNHEPTDAILFRIGKCFLTRDPGYPAARSTLGCWLKSLRDKLHAARQTRDGTPQSTVSGLTSPIDVDEKKFPALPPCRCAKRESSTFTVPRGRPTIAQPLIGWVYDFGRHYSPAGTKES
jgi:hypothetical protein